MILVDRDIRALLRHGKLRLDPFDDELIQPTSIDLRMGTFARVLKSCDSILDIREKPNEQYADIEIPSEGYVLPPMGYLIVQTLELMRMPEDCQGRIEQRSSLVRLGLHVSSSLINPGYEGYLPCLLFNQTARAVRIFPRVPFCQLVLHRCSGLPDVGYHEKKDAKYQGEGPFRMSAIDQDARRWIISAPRLVNPEQARTLRVEMTLAEEEEDA